MRDFYSDPFHSLCVSVGEDERTKKCKSSHYFPPRKKPQFYNVMSDKGVFVSSVIIM